MAYPHNLPFPQFLKDESTPENYRDQPYVTIGPTHELYEEWMGDGIWIPQAMTTQPRYMNAIRQNWDANEKLGKVKRIQRDDDICAHYGWPWMESEECQDKDKPCFNQQVRKCGNPSFAFEKFRTAENLNWGGATKWGQWARENRGIGQDFAGIREESGLPTAIRRTAVPVFRQTLEGAKQMGADTIDTVRKHPGKAALMGIGLAAAAMTGATPNQTSIGDDIVPVGDGPFSASNLPPASEYPIALRQPPVDSEGQCDIPGSCPNPEFQQLAVRPDGPLATIPTGIPALEFQSAAPKVADEGDEQTDQTANTMGLGAGAGGTLGAAAAMAASFRSAGKRSREMDTETQNKRSFLGIESDRIRASPRDTPQQIMDRFPEVMEEDAEEPETWQKYRKRSELRLEPKKNTELPLMIEYMDMLKDGYVKEDTVRASPSDTPEQIMNRVGGG